MTTKTLVIGLSVATGLYLLVSLVAPTLTIVGQVIAFKVGVTLASLAV